MFSPASAPFGEAAASAASSRMDEGFMFMGANHFS
jgi:hypothetical protein